MFGVMWKLKLMKNDSTLFKLWCWLVDKKWYQILLIPHHYILGIYYRYNLKQITYFCLGIINNKIYKEQYKEKERLLYGRN